MAEGSGGYTGYRQEGSYEVRYKNGEEVSRRWINGGSGSYEGGEGGGYGDGGWSARIEAILGSCQSILSSLQDIFSGSQNDLSTSRSNWAKLISKSAGHVKELAKKLLPQTSRTKSGNVIETEAA